jgi:hypothetical protein
MGKSMSELRDDMEHLDSCAQETADPVNLRYASVLSPVDRYREEVLIEER